MKTSDLVLEVNAEMANKTGIKQVGNVQVMICPPVDADYWTFRVKVSDRQAVVGFPKFLTIGIGFAIEDADWNTNLPYRCGPQEIWDHIKKNKGDDTIPDELCQRAIEMVVSAATMYMAASKSA